MTTYTMEEDIAASYALASAGDGAITADSVNEFLESEVVPLSDLRERRRKLAEAQGKADDIKSRICNSVNADTSRALHERIMDLRDSDREMYDYIWRLRSLKYGIWCTQCEQMKQIGGRDPENVKRDVEAEARGEPPEHHAVKKHVQLSQNNKMLPLLTGAEKTQIEQRHGNVVLTTHAPRIADRTKSMSRAQLAALPDSLRKTVMADSSFQIREPEAKPRIMNDPEPAARAKVQHSIPEEVLQGMDQRVAALIKLRDQIGEQLKQVDSFVGSLQSLARADAPVNTVTEAEEKKSPGRVFRVDDDAVIADATGADASFDADADAPDIDDVIERAMKMNMGDEDDIEGF